MPIVEKLIRHADVFPDDIAIGQLQGNKTYSNLCSDIRRVATKLKLDGVGENDIVMLVATNDYGFICSYFATHLIGGVVVNLAPDADEEYKNLLLEKTAHCFIIEDCDGYIAKLASYPEFVYSELNDDRLAEIVFTSGTTGEAKGVTLTHRESLAATKHIISQVNNSQADVELLLMPLSHSFGMARMRTTLFAGGQLVLGYSLLRLKTVFKAFELYGITGIGLVPSAWRYILNMSKEKIAGYAGQLNYIEFGSAHLPNDDKCLLKQWFPKTHIVVHYGLTEVSRAQFIFLHTDPMDAVGYLPRGCEVLIMGDGEELIGDDSVGEILLKADWMTSGYYQNSELTSDNFVDGYIKTGDQGYVQGECLFLTGRIKEIINVGGKKVNPYRIEKLMNSFDFVNESACSSGFDIVSGEVVNAFVVLDQESTVSETDAIDQIKIGIAANFPSYMRPVKYHFLACLPKTSTGKIKRLTLSIGKD